MMIYIFWDKTPCSPLKVNRRFGGTCCLHLQGRRISQPRNRREASRKAENSAASVFKEITELKFFGHDGGTSNLFKILIILKLIPNHERSECLKIPGS
jgi:hypothetical protein